MTDQEDVRALVRQEVAAAIAPLRAELDRVRALVELNDGPAGESPVTVAAGHAPSAVAPATVPVAPVQVSNATQVPAERDDFARMLRRGLEAEARQSDGDADRAPAPKKGWNPFRR